jgi:steroid 5-alpha reductase family enzyme
MLSMLFWSLVIALAINGILFLVAFRLQSDRLTDVSYAVTFIALALFVFARSDETASVTGGTILVCLWALRIGGFLLYRIMQTGRDRRFDGIREHFLHFGTFWLGQAITVWVLMFPLALSAHNPWNGRAWIGVVLWIWGLTIESFADAQKYRFTHNPTNKGHWIDGGLWRYSRHPNYLGEIIIWVGIYLYALPDLSTSGKLLGILSPLLITTLLLYVSGIPALEKSADKRWGDDRAYVRYKRSTSLLIPFPKRK